MPIVVRGVFLDQLLPGIEGFGCAFLGIANLLCRRFSHVTAARMTVAVLSKSLTTTQAEKQHQGNGAIYSPQWMHAGFVPHGLFCQHELRIVTNADIFFEGSLILPCSVREAWWRKPGVKVEEVCFYRLPFRVIFLKHMNQVSSNSSRHLH